MSIENLKVYTNSNEDVNGFTYIKNGNGMIIDVDKENVEELLNKLESFSGVEFSTNSNVNKILKALNVKKIKVEKINNIINMYGYINNIYNYVLINNNKYNIQISIRDGVKKIGIPIIFGSY